MSPFFSLNKDLFNFSFLGTLKMSLKFRESIGIMYLSLCSASLAFAQHAHMKLNGAYNPPHIKIPNSHIFLPHSHLPLEAYGIKIQERQKKWQFRIRKHIKKHRKSFRIPLII